MARVYDDEKNMHDGHRQRLIDTVYKVGLDNVSQVQAVEYVLFFVFPRGDVNPLAHRLLDRFHDFPTILEASIEDLQEVRGMGETSAKKLHSFLEIFFFYSMGKLGQERIESKGEFYDYLENLLRFCKEEQLFLFGVDASGSFVKGRRFGKGDNEKVSIGVNDLALYISTHKVPKMFVVHNHPGGTCMPSVQDQDTFDDLEKLFKLSKANLVDSLIIGKDGIYSMKNKSFARMFTTGEEYMKLASIEGRRRAKK